MHPSTADHLPSATRNRILNTTGGARPGPLLLVFGAIHGNEIAGPAAIRLVFEMLEKEAANRPDFRFHGKFTGLLGNLGAIEKGLRFQKNDLNRVWTIANVEQAMTAKNPEFLDSETREIREIIDCLHAESANFKPARVVLLDLHTTSADDGIFTIPTAEPASVWLATDLKAPVITGLMEGIEGTMTGFFSRFGMPGPLPVHPVCLAFEAGQHADPISVHRAAAVIIHCLRAIGCIGSDDLKNPLEADLEHFADGLPRLSELVHIHPISLENEFEMRPGYRNFQKISLGEHLADDRRGPVLSPENGRILMPLYQKQGSDGFFIIREIW